MLVTHEIIELYIELTDNVKEECALVHTEVVSKFVVCTSLFCGIQLKD